MARLGAAAGAAVLRAARTGVARVKFSNHLAIEVREMVDTGRGLSRSSITKTIMDVSSPEARSEQAKR